MIPPPERIWLQTHETYGDDVEYVRADLADGSPPRLTPWAQTEEERAIYLVAAMTGRSVEEVAQPLTDFLHSLRYESHGEVRGMVVTELDAWEGEVGE
jgi:hypothetical protein